jgi:sarcosine oxidase, subunit alpha
MTQDETPASETPKRSVAGAWLLSGNVAVSRSFRLHRQRGGFCHHGWCQQCKVTGPDGRVVLACMTAEGTLCKPASGTDPLRVMGRIAEAQPPWFYENHAIGPGPVRQVYLETMRRMSAALPLPRPVQFAKRARTTSNECDTLVVGGGISGLAAAVALAVAGKLVTLVEAGALGNSALEKGIDAQVLRQHITTARAGVHCLEHTLCAGLYDGATRALCVGAEGNVVVNFQELVVATGAYDRMPTVAGNDLPGIVGMRAFERLVQTRSIVPGARIGVYSAEIEAARALSAARRAGLTISFVAGPQSLPASNVRTLPRVKLVAVQGRSRVRQVALDTGERLKCDLLVMGFSQPSYELQAQNGAQMHLRGDPPAVWPTRQGHARLLAVGEAAGWFDSSGQAERSERLVVDWLNDRPSHDPAPLPTAPTPNTAHEDAFLCHCEDVRVRDVRQAIADGYRDVELVKRHTGAGTGPCQGKLCHGALLGCTAEAGLEVRIPTPRPLTRPVTIAELAAAAPGVPEEK